MQKNKIILGILALIITSLMVWQIPAVQNRLILRYELITAYLRGIIYPADAVPTPKAIPHLTREPNTPTPKPTMALTSTPNTASTPLPTPTLLPTATPIPSAASLTPPQWEQQDWNNCGPATLALYLRYYGWDGDQYDISDLLKPERADRNVNVEELVYYARNYAGWLNTIYRVGGDIELLKKFIAAGIPVVVEASFYFEAPYWPNDDLWAAHYLLVTAYDDASGVFTVQDTYYGPDQMVDYETFDANWQSFNRVYILSYPPEQEARIRDILGEDWDEVRNREHALEVAQRETEADPENAFAWFNLGTNLVYFKRYPEAAEAYDRARSEGLPQRMYRYQFGPFFAYFHSGRTDDLLALTEYALQRTPNSEEALLWHGWAQYRLGNINDAVADFRKALSYNPNYLDAQYALDFVLNQ